MSIIVTGANDFVGYNLTPKLKRMFLKESIFS